MRRLTPAAIAGIAIAAVLLLLVAITFARRHDADQDKLGEDELVAAEGTAPESKCASQATYDLIKAELFRQAADTRGSDQSAYDRIAATAVVRMERPLLKGRDREMDLLRCSGRLSLDLPPGLSVVGGRTRLSADIDYIVQPAADSSGDVVMIEGADSIIVPLATLASGRNAATPQSAPGTIPSVADGFARNEVQPPSQQVSPPAPQPSAQPSFNCRYARTRGEIAVCRDPGLAALDQQMASQYSRAASSADPRQQAVLRATRDAFLRYRDQCPSDACIAAAYRDRMREIEDIRTGRWRPGR